MSMAEDIAGKVSGGAGDDEVVVEEEAKLEPGDAGKRLRAAIAAKDDVAIEEAIRDCVGGTY